LSVSHKMGLEVYGHHLKEHAQSPNERGGKMPFSQDVKYIPDVPRVYVLSFSTKYPTDIFIYHVKVVTFLGFAKMHCFVSGPLNANEHSLTRIRV